MFVYLSVTILIITRAIPSFVSITEGDFFHVNMYSTFILSLYVIGNVDLLSVYITLRMRISISVNNQDGELVEADDRCGAKSLLTKCCKYWFIVSNAQKRSIYTYKIYLLFNCVCKLLERGFFNRFQYDTLDSRKVKVDFITN